MDAITAITQAGPLLRAATGFVGALRNRHQASASDFAAQLRSQVEANAAKLLQARDKDGSGGLSRAELGVDGQTFARLDANGDGQVTAAEMAAAELAASER